MQSGFSISLVWNVLPNFGAHYFSACWSLSLDFLSTTKGRGETLLSVLFRITFLIHSSLNRKNLEDGRFFAI